MLEYSIEAHKLSPKWGRRETRSETRLKEDRVTLSTLRISTQGLQKEKNSLFFSSSPFYPENKGEARELQKHKNELIPEINTEAQIRDGTKGKKCGGIKCQPDLPLNKWRAYFFPPSSFITCFLLSLFQAIDNEDSALKKSTSSNAFNSIVWWLTKAFSC